ncbi:unnamed protein product [Blepharisma stoltei]|uniref:ethanolamine-phosphate cytidylyltransferase n=1 Tax=Blepharisma stoltei TaxID=1481888 RepID=A0AAU9J2G7_9CILI|nr:unnamed protein product [Blepharisma stoltei]
MQCSIQGCSDKAKSFCSCTESNQYLCDSHTDLHLKSTSSSDHKLENIYTQPVSQTKQSLLLHIVKKISDLKKSKTKSVVDSNQEIREIQTHMESALEKFDSDIKSYIDLMAEIISTEEIVKNDKSFVSTLLQLPEEDALRFLDEFYSSSPKTQDFLTSLNISKNVQTEASIPEETKNHEKMDRIYMDGCFDLMHSGHFNAIRQAKSLGKVLVVGVHSDAEITRNKGPPVMNEQERYQLVRACKWVDEVMEEAPYSPTIQLLDSLNCQYAAHGDDLSINADGSDCMSILKRAGRCKIFKRTEGISTTTLVGKLLLMTRDELLNIEQPRKSNEISSVNDSIQAQLDRKSILTTSRRISEFSNKKEPKNSDTIVYIDGTFDLFHAGHVETLRRARQFGDYLLVGIHDDQTVNHYKGSNYPIMSLHDRVMCVLSIKYVDEVIIGAPWVISKELLTGFNIKYVCGGTVTKGTSGAYHWRKGSIEVEDCDPYQIPKEMGIYRQIESAFDLDTDIIISRIVNNRLKFLSKFEKTSQREAKYVENKEYIPEA